MSRRTGWTAVVLAAALAAAPHPARSDAEETEERLKLGGVKDDVRARIARAIARGAPDDGRPLVTLERSARWLARHGDAGAPPWR